MKTTFIQIVIGTTDVYENKETILVTLDLPTKPDLAKHAVEAALEQYAKITQRAMEENEREDRGRA